MKNDKIYAEIRMQNIPGYCSLFNQTIHKRLVFLSIRAISLFSLRKLYKYKKYIHEIRKNKRVYVY